MTKNSHLQWKVKYAPGALLARGYTGGKEIVADKVETSGEPSAILLKPRHATIKADSEDVSVITVQVNDAQQRIVPTASNEIAFTISGPGNIIGVGNGDPASHEPDVYLEKATSQSTDSPPQWKRSLFSGLAQIIVQSTREPGEITLTAKSQGLSEGVLKIQSKPAIQRRCVP
jgi:beta-galactosidase